MKKEKYKLYEMGLSYSASAREWVIGWSDGTITREMRPANLPISSKGVIKEDDYSFIYNMTKVQELPIEERNKLVKAVVETAKILNDGLFNKKKKSNP